ncbi:MAG TPA: type IX secretion system membrane protein PorP/SprF [Bacteroidia bacterium]|nr:type IX secretion system membrane protein PorP/SprF [Bacteroidia bacterium]
MQRLFGFLFIFSISIGLSIQANAQQLAQYTMYTFNHFGINPAAPGDPKCMAAKIGYRNQWVGFEGNPVSEFLSIQAAIPRRNRNFRKGYSSTGLYLENDQTGPTRYTGFYLNYAYHRTMVKETYLSVGLFAGTMMYNYDKNAVITASQTDNAITASKTKFIFPDINPGIWIHNDNAYAGLSIKNVIGNSLTKVYGINSKLTRHFYLNAGYRWLSQDKSFSLIPSIMLKYSPYSAPGVDFNFLYDYYDKFDLGVSYRLIDGASAMFRIKMGKFIYLSYAYDYNTSKIKIASNNTHEVMLHFKLCKSKEGIDKPREICPAYQ